jgi:predicted Mrr-cat superfamily restriction endonuclease
MMRIPNNLYIKCNECDHISLVEADGLDCETYTYDRSMGEEIEHNFRGEICCEQCHSWINFNICGYEYPVGAFNFSDSECCGGEFVDEPVVEIEYEFDDYYYEEAYGEYLKAEGILEFYRNKIKNMSHRDFEFFVADIFEKLGFSVKITQATRDGGQDIIATKSDPIPYTLIVECKHWREEHKVDVSVVRSVYGVQVATQANQSVVVTSSKFTKDARKFAEEQKNLIELWDIDDLIRLVT